MNCRSFLGMLAALPAGIKAVTDAPRLNGRDLDYIAFDEMDDFDRASLQKMIGWLDTDCAERLTFLTVGADEIPAPHLPHAAKIGDTIVIRRPQRYRRIGNA